MVSGVRSKMFVHTVDTSYSAGAVPENLWVAGPISVWDGSAAPPPLLMYVHGAAQFGPDSMIGTNGLKTTDMLLRLAEYFTVCFADLGSMSVGDRWGGPDHVQRIDELRVYMNTTFSTSGKMTLVGESMGSLAALNYTRYAPTAVRLVAAMIPVLDLNDYRTRMGASGAIDPAYPPSGYSQVTHGSLYNPMTHASLLPSQDVLPIQLFYSQYDPAIPLTYISGYQAARPGTLAMDCSYAPDSPSGGHSENTIGVGTAEVIRFCRYGNSTSS